MNLDDSSPAEFSLFAERGARAIVSVNSANLACVLDIARQYGVGAREIGQVTHNNAFRIQYNGRELIDSSVDLLRDAWANSLERILVIK